jgi:hypothetical protein
VGLNAGCGLAIGGVIHASNLHTIVHCADSSLGSVTGSFIFQDLGADETEQTKPFNSGDVYREDLPVCPFLMVDSRFHGGVKPLPLDLYVGIPVSKWMEKLPFRGP